MMIYAVVTLNTNPYGEIMGDGRTNAVFASRKSANAYMRELRKTDAEKSRFRWQYAVRSFKVEN